MRPITRLANSSGVLTPSGESTNPGSLAPCVLSASAVIEQLRSFRIGSARSAVAQLATWHESSHILSLYRRYFPRQFARSTTRTQIPIQHHEPGYSDRELEFFTLVDRHLFPLPEFMFDAERLPNLPIYP
jgi:hypothetical protein